MPIVGTRLLEPYIGLGPELRTPTLLVLTAYHMHTCSNANIIDKTCGENRCLVIHCLLVQQIKLKQAEVSTRTAPIRYRERIKHLHLCASPAIVF